MSLARMKSLSRSHVVEFVTRSWMKSKDVRCQIVIRGYRGIRLLDGLKSPARMLTVLRLAIAWESHGSLAHVASVIFAKAEMKIFAQSSKEPVVTRMVATLNT